MKFKFVILNLVCFLQFLLLICNNFNDVECVSMKMIASTNVSVVEIGQPFTLNCQVDNWTLGKNDWFYVIFGYNKSNNLGDYEIHGT